ncbi:GNAT family N-acetyltransferase [Caedibacter taeniospiralis]|jgi:ribosomal protein S18 acetylase RimI-like enzyme|uniref:GNAT family N-acetyltransferase n=1 Tax=Caedibacter taeniospiralis TaxID=28907 RepID=UPI0037C02768
MYTIENVQSLEFIRPGSKRLSQCISDSVALYSKYLVQSGEFQAIEKARLAASNEFNNLLNYCILRDELYFYELYSNQRGVGYLWFIYAADEKLEKEQQQAFLAYIYINKAHRRHAYAKQALRLYENTAMAMGASNSRLFVFKHNLPAIALYQSQGYQIKNHVGFYEAEQENRHSRLEMIKQLR